METVNRLLTREEALSDLKQLPIGYKTADVDRLISRYVKEKRDASPLRARVLSEGSLHRIYFHVSLRQIKDANERLEWIDSNLLFNDWWQTDENIDFISDADADRALELAKGYVLSADTFTRRWGYVMFINRLCRSREALSGILGLTHDDPEYYVRMAEAWLIAELAVFFPEKTLAWLKDCKLKYNITGKAVQKVCDSFRITDEYKARFKELRPRLKLIK